MTRQVKAGVLLGVSVWCLCWAASAGGAEEQLAQAPERILDPRPKVLVVNGYSTSRHWPGIFQRKLDRYFGSRVVEVQSAIKGGTPIAKWIDVEKGTPLAPWTKIVRPALARSDARPRIVLAQQSLQWAFGDRTEGIRNARDRERIERGADVLQKYVELLLADGVREVFVAMHIYKHPMEPAIGNERMALAEFLTRDVRKVHAGPDVWEPTKALYPKAFAEDLVHPNLIGAEVMAQKWFETLLAHDGLEVPKWSREEMDRAVASGSQPNHPWLAFSSWDLARSWSAFSISPSCRYATFRLR